MVLLILLVIASIVCLCYVSLTSLCPGEIAVEAV